MSTERKPFITSEGLPSTDSVGLMIGADPELFAYDLKTEKFISAHNLIPGNKYDPFPVKCGAVQVDGVACEFNINPVDNADDFVDNIQSVVDVMTLMVHRTAGDHAILMAQPVAYFEEKYFASLPHEALALGCEPDYNAYTGQENPRPETNEPFRTGAGHLHVGWDENVPIFDPAHFHDCMMLTKQLDAALFIPSLLWDKDEKRRTLYGKYGSFRPKSYGVEYRPLSNSWVRLPSVQRWLFDTIELVTHCAMGGWFLFEEDIVKETFEKYDTGWRPNDKEIRDYCESLNFFGIDEVPEIVGASK